MSDGFPPNFAPYEFKCKCDGRHCSGLVPYPDRIRHLAWVLQSVRNKCNTPININSGYRCPQHNKLVGGAKHSQHVQATAADIVSPTLPPAKVADIVEDLMEQGAIPNGGIGRYNTFTHIDIRHDKARWSG